MATLIAEYRGGRGGRRCDAKCYGGHFGQTCTCICGGVNHGVGFASARANVRDGIAGDGEGMRRGGVLVVRVVAEQLELWEEGSLEEGSKRAREQSDREEKILAAKERKGRKG